MDCVHFCVFGISPDLRDGGPLMHLLQQRLLSPTLLSFFCILFDPLEVKITEMGMKFAWLPHFPMLYLIVSREVLRGCSLLHTKNRSPAYLCSHRNRKSAAFSLTLDSSWIKSF